MEKQHQMHGSKKIKKTTSKRESHGSLHTVHHFSSFKAQIHHQSTNYTIDTTILRIKEVENVTS
jgi:hypothetical protein